MNLLDLPNEILDMIIRKISIGDLLRLQQCSREYYNVFHSFLSWMISRMNWRVVVDFARDSNHHILLHRAWIELYPPSLDLRNHIFLYGPCPRSSRHYLLIRHLFSSEQMLNQGKVDLFQGRPYVLFRKHYLPLILGITVNPDTVTCQDGIVLIPSRFIIITQLHETDNLIVESGKREGLLSFQDDETNSIQLYLQDHGQGGARTSKTCVLIREYNDYLYQNGNLWILKSHHQLYQIKFSTE